MVAVSRACLRENDGFPLPRLHHGLRAFGDKPLRGGGVPWLAFFWHFDVKRLQDCERGPVLCRPPMPSGLFFDNSPPLPNMPVVALSVFA